MKISKKTKIFAALVIIIGLAVYVYVKYPQSYHILTENISLFGSDNASSTLVLKTPYEKDKYVRFEMEAFDTIYSNYWMPHDRMTPKNLAELYRLSYSKIASTSVDTIPNDRTSLAQMLGKVFDGLKSEKEKHDLALNILNIVVTNLEPFGRNAVHSKAQEKAFRDIVKNVDENKDLYKDLGIAKGSSVEEVKQAYVEKVKEIESSTSTNKQAEKDKVAYAKKVLADTNTKTQYDTNKAEPTIVSKIMNKTLYMHIARMSPTTLQEFGRAVIDASSTPNLNSLIIDLRGNIGGVIDLLKYFLGYFVGQNQPAFDFYHQGDFNVQRTVTPKVPEVARFKEIAIYIDKNSLSTAELMAETFRHFRIAHIVGTTSGGWGSIEDTYPLNTLIDDTEQYALVLVNSLTVREDLFPIQGRGVDPDVDVSKPNWQDLVPKYFESSSIIDAIKSTASKPALTN